MRLYSSWFCLRVVLFVIVCFSQASMAEAKPASFPQRIVSLSPSITEIVYALGGGDRLVGVTPYCDYPAAARLLPKVGGLYDPNIEVILGLKPDLIIAPIEHSFSQKKIVLNKSKIVFVKQETVSEILESIRTIAEPLGLASNAVRIISGIQGELSGLRKPLGSDSRRVLVVLGGSSKPGSFYIAGEKSLYNELLELLGARNAYRGPVEFPRISAEGLVALQPDVVINLVSSDELESQTIEEKKKKLKQAWNRLPGFGGLEKDKVFILTDEYLVNPGPRIHMIAKKFRDVLAK